MTLVQENRRVESFSLYIMHGVIYSEPDKKSPALFRLYWFSFLSDFMLEQVGKTTIYAAKGNESYSILPSYDTTRGFKFGSFLEDTLELQNQFTYII